MDPISTTISVIPLALQLGKGISKLSGFLQSIQDAPAEVAWILEELDFLEVILNQIKLSNELHGPQVEVKRALKRCVKSLKGLDDIAELLAPGFASSSRITRKWTAVEVVWKSEQIKQFKNRLAEAKTNLIIAQNLSLSHAQHQHYQELSRALIEIHQRISYQGRVVTSYRKDDVRVLEEESTDARALCSDWPPRRFQAVLERQLLEANEETSNSTDQTSISESTSNPICGLQRKGHSISSGPRRVQVGGTQHLVNWGFLGEVHRSVTEYKVTRPFDVGINNGNEKIDDIEGHKYERETIYRYTPSRQALVPKNALIFDFCRSGNAAAVRYLLQKGLASVDDINEFDETPLHLAASHCRSDVCKLLLACGADQGAEDVKNETPFTRACLPCNIESALRGTVCSMTNFTLKEEFMSTLREFLAGRDLEDIDKNGRGIGSLTLADNSVTDLPTEGLFHWITSEILPLAHTYELGNYWWDHCLSAMVKGHRDPYLFNVLRSCDVQVVQSAFLLFVNDIACGDRDDKRDQSTFNLLAERCGGITFLAEYCGKFDSPFSASIRNSTAFVRFRKILKTSKCDLDELARREIELHGCGWTKNNLTSLLRNGYPVMATNEPKELRCKTCA